jgi:hypothetical protein
MLRGVGGLRYAALGLGGLCAGTWLACALPGGDEFARGAPRSADDGGPESSSGLGADAAGPGDGASEASTTTSGGCKAMTGAVFCADFDGQPFDLGFVPNTASPIGTLAADPTHVISTPSALLATLPQRSAGQPYAFLEHTLPAGLTSFRVAWSAYLDDQGSSQSAVDFGVALVREGNPYRALAIRYERPAGGTPSFVLFEYGNATATKPQIVDFTPIQAAPAPRFQRFELLLATNGESSNVRLTIDGTTALPAKATTLYDQTSPYSLYVGIAASDGAGGAVSVYVDDVVVTQP